MVNNFLFHYVLTQGIHVYNDIKQDTLEFVVDIEFANKSQSGCGLVHGIVSFIGFTTPCESHMEEKVDFN